MPWAYKPSLATPRFGLAAATFDAPAPQSGSRIYAIGGGDLSGNAILASVETYETSTPEENWLPINPMHRRAQGSLPPRVPMACTPWAVLTPSSQEGSSRRTKSTIPPLPSGCRRRRACPRRGNISPQPRVPTDSSMRSAD